MKNLHNCDQYKRKWKNYKPVLENVVSELVVSVLVAVLYTDDIVENELISRDEDISIETTNDIKYNYV